jgi:serine/threonine-protein kinase RsbT
MAARSLSIEVRVEHDVASVIAAVARLCATHGLPAVFTGHVATAASELANNLWMHSQRGGQLSLALSGEGAGRSVELRADDDGPGIADIPRALSEGYSTGGGLGCGLPGVQRLMDEFSIDSAAGQGTRVVARKWLTSRR